MADLTHLAPIAVRSRCERCAIRHQAVCGALSETEIEAMNAIARQRLVKAGDVILQAEAETTFFSNIISGVVKLSKVLSDGRQQIVGLQFPPDFLGRAYRRHNPYYAEAATDLELCVFPKTGFERLLREHPGLETRLFQNTLDELDAAREWMLLLGRKTAVEKVASFLALIARRNPIAGCAYMGAPSVMTLALPLTRAEIADYLGLTIETVSRQLGKMRADHILEVGANRTVTVLDPEGLERLAQL